MGAYLVPQRLRSRYRICVSRHACAAASADHCHCWAVNAVAAAEASSATCARERWRVVAQAASRRGACANACRNTQRNLSRSYWTHRRRSHRGILVLVCITGFPLPPGCVQCFSVQIPVLFPAVKPEPTPLPPFGSDSVLSVLPCFVLAGAARSSKPLPPPPVSCGGEK